MDPTNPQTYKTLEQHAEDTEKLTAFRKAIGIHDPILCDHCHEEVGYKNTGIYKQVIQEERKSGIIYYTSSFFINLCLLLQLLIATALTVLGACNGPSRWVTYFSIANFVIACILGYAKLQDFPNRPGQLHTALIKVREYIEQREREFYYPAAESAVSAEVKTIVEMHNLAVQTGQKKGPSAYKMMLSHALVLVKSTSKRSVDKMTSSNRRNTESAPMTSENVRPLSYGTNMLSSLSGKNKLSSLTGKNMLSSLTGWFKSKEASLRDTGQQAEASNHQAGANV